jgi:hypothetical protein
MLDWFRALDKYFDYEDIKEDKKKQRIKSWDRMVEKMKSKFIPRDYQINLF